MSINLLVYLKFSHTERNVVALFLGMIAVCLAMLETFDME